MNILKLIFLFSCNFSLSLSSKTKEANVTIQLCCRTDEYFHMKSYKCEPLPISAINFQWKLNLKYLNRTEKKVNILENFIFKVHLPCEKPEALHWKWNETIDVKTIKDNVEFCFTPYYVNASGKFVPMQLDCSLEKFYFLSFRHEYLYFFSGFLMIPTLIIYVALKPLHEHLMGKCLICYLGSVIATNCIYFVIPHMLRIRYHFHNLVFISLALVHFYLNMAIVFWLNVLGIETWLNFSVLRENFNNKSVKKKRFLFYSIYAWTLGGITTIPTIVRNVPYIWDYCNRYEQSKSCIIVAYITLYVDIYFAPIVMTILVINFLIFCGVSFKIYTIRGKFNQIGSNENSSKENIIICARLFVLMGPHWIVIYILKDYRYIEILIVSLNYIESVLVFILFVLRKKVLRMIFNSNSK